MQEMRKRMGELGLIAMVQGPGAHLKCLGGDQGQQLRGGRYRGNGSVFDLEDSTRNCLFGDI